MRAARRHARGQATVELALGSLVVVTLLIIAGYLTEVQFLGLKMHEAAAYAAYDAMHERSQETRTVSVSQLGRVTSGSAASPGGRATDRYRDFNGVNTGGPSTITQTMTRATALEVQCERAPQLDDVRGSSPYVPIPSLNASGDLDYELASRDHDFMLALSAEYAALFDALKQMHPDQGGVACHSQALVTAMAPRSFLDGSGGFFKAPMPLRSLFTICSPGRARNGACPGAYPLLVGDFSLGANRAVADHADCTLTGCSNLTYSDMVRRLYEVNVGPVARARWASTLAGKTRGFSPIDETQFFMSFSGVEHGFVDGVAGGHKHNTSGASGHGALVPVPWNGCFLGVPGC